MSRRKKNEKEKEEIQTIKEDLIPLVQRHPIIWNTSEPNHFDKNKITNAWLSILSSLKEIHGSVLSQHSLDSISALKQIWKNMKDYYYQKKKKQTAPSGSGLANVELDPKWPFFTALSFLGSSTVSLPTASSISATPKTSVFVSESNDKDEEDITINDRGDANHCDDLVEDDVIEELSND